MQCDLIKTTKDIFNDKVKHFFKFLNQLLFLVKEKKKSQNWRLNYHLPLPVVCSSPHLKCATSLHSQPGILDASITP